MSIDALFSASAGRAERMLRRQYDNPLFGDIEVSSFDIQQARQRDTEEVEAFVNEFRELVQQVAEMAPNAEADVVLKHKEALDKAYETSAGLAGEQAEMQEMIKRLLALMMQSMWKAVGNDAQGISKLEKEEQAREAHFALLAYPFITDLLSPDSPINEQVLLPSLLSEPPEVVSLAVQLFDPQQQKLLFMQGRELLQGLDSSHHRVKQAQQSLQEIAGLLQPANQQAD